MRTRDSVDASPVLSPRFIREGGVDAVAAAGEEVEEAARLGLIRRFAQNSAAQRDGGVGAERDVAFACGDGGEFLGCDACAVVAVAVRPCAGLRRCRGA